jgi:hypothetical protein
VSASDQQVRRLCTLIGVHQFSLRDVLVVAAVIAVVVFLAIATHPLSLLAVAIVLVGLALVVR